MYSTEITVECAGTAAINFSFFDVLGKVFAGNTVVLFFALNLPLLVLLIAPFNNFHLVVSYRCGMCCVVCRM